MQNQIGFISNYFIDNDKIYFYFDNGTSMVVFLNENSGRIIKRQKINTAFGIWHVGIYLGTTADGFQIVAHNHYLVRKPSIATMTQFAQGKEVYWDNRNCNQTKSQIIKNALSLILEKREYHITNFNCQTYVNLCCINQHKSEAVENAFKGIGIGASIFLGVLLIGVIVKS